MCDPESVELADQRCRRRGQRLRVDECERPLAVSSARTSRRPACVRGRAAPAASRCLTSRFPSRSQKVTMLPSGLVTPTTRRFSSMHTLSDSPIMRSMISCGRVMVSNGPAAVRMVTPPSAVSWAAPRAAPRTPRRRGGAERQVARVDAGRVPNVSVSRSFVDHDVHERHAGRSARLSMAPPPFVMTSVLPASIR